MKESWSDSIRFSLAAILSASLLAIVILSPRVVRNENFKQLCYDQQLELIDLEANNTDRKRFANRIEHSPELMEQISRKKNSVATTYEKSIALPESLVIHPDQMLLAPSEKSSSKSISQRPESWYLKYAQWMESSPMLKNRLLISAGLLLLFSSIPSAWFHWRFFRRQFRLRTAKIIARYRRHTAHEAVLPPHWESTKSTQTQSEDSQQDNATISITDRSL